MGAIPTSGMPGHKGLHDRVASSLDRCQESPGIDFKESAPWEALKWRIVRMVLGMGNLRDGGIIVVGASERNAAWSLTGISEDDLATYDVDVIVGTINAYASPHIVLDIVTVQYNGNRFLAIQANEFSDTPLVCKKNGPADLNGTAHALEEGAVYIRPAGMVRTTKVTDATQMHELLELAAEKRARRILEMAQRVGIGIEVGPPFGMDIHSRSFNNELEGL